MTEEKKKYAYSSCCLFIPTKDSATHVRRRKSGKEGRALTQAAHVVRGARDSPRFPGVNLVTVMHSLQAARLHSDFYHDILLTYLRDFDI